MGMTVREIELPNYSLAQELWNAISHGLGTLIALIGGPFLLIKCAETGDAWRIVSCSIFLFAILIMYVFSCLYHAMGRNAGKKVLRVMDHDMVFVLIMGTYTPYCLVSIREYSSAWGWSIWGIVMTLGIVGIVLNSCNIKKFAIFSMIDYILMGWACVIAFYPLVMALGWWPGTALLLMGGIAYTVGAALYGLGKKHSPWWHSVFHFFCLAGTILMFVSIYLAVA